ncbi:MULTISPECIES: MerR family transcriptional regulator [Pontibacillus]|uniref:MerR family transcriptional regulator n=1 Tax=Pontibacillus chungwhensis TaxID=265426 RepID=A0ABY8UVF9_9BACI|nr:MULTISPECIES: MerR family transcriptional regulator [Pontibacillus]MCD5323021.1 MerR family transcriptional regulator [Pontibacillus sp. HN14]WIF96415.1 MerR family transcriptional regulator [Pontibacillus chungwhensis]
MSSTQGKYNIKAVSTMLGIQSGTLRAWERRYKMIRPTRNEAGHRLYTDEHIKVLKWLIDKVNRGFTISQAVSLLESNQSQQTTISEENTTTNESHVESVSDELLDALLRFNEREAQMKLDHAFSLFTPEKVAIDIVGPILVKIGDLWESNEISSVHEHFASNFLRSRLGMMLVSMPANHMQPKAVCVCGPNERHELGILIFSLYLKRQGYDVVYLGQSIAPGDVEVIVNELKPKYLFLSCTMKKNIPSTVHIADALKERYPDLEIGLGGFALDTLPHKDKEPVKPYIIGSTSTEWEEWLSNHS